MDMARPEQCSLCSVQLGPLLAEARHWRLILNREQDLLGASFLALRRHVESPTELRSDEWSELRGSIQGARDLLARAFHPDHFNFAFLGNVERHLHLHVLPRYASKRVAIGQTFTDPGYPGHYALVDTGRLAADQLERLADEIRSS
jgi:diadenosine tetraphosphate (Ap4A) HIT family hydrolase